MLWLLSTSRYQIQVEYLLAESQRHRAALFVNITGKQDTTSNKAATNGFESPTQGRKMQRLGKLIVD